MYCLRKRVISVVMIVVVALSIFAIQIPFANKSNAADTGDIIKWTEGIEGGAIYFNKNTGMITDCDSYVLKVNIPEEIEGVKVISIGNYAFRNCESLENITFPDSITSIGTSAFEFCSSLTSITIPDSVTSIGEHAFDNCNSLISITVDDNNKKYVSKEGVLFDKSMETLIKYPAGNECLFYDIPEGVINIEELAFYYCDSLTSITIPNSVTNIGNMAFFNCYSLKSIIIPDSVTSIGESAFRWCYNLESITIPSSVIFIGMDAFYYCQILTIYGYEESFVQGYANDSNIPFVVISENINNSESLNLTEDDLFGEYANYLYNNETYNALLWNLYDTFDDSSYKASNDLSSAVKLAMKIVGEFDVIRYVKLMAGIDDTDEEIAEELALEIIRGAENNSNFEKEILNKVESYYDWTSNTYGIVSGGFKTERQKKEVAELLGSGYLYSESSAMKFLKDVENEWEEIDNTFKAAGYTINSAQFVSEIVMTMEANHLIVTTLMDSVPKDSVLYEGLKSIEQKQKKSLTENLAKKFIEDGAIEEIADALIEKGVSYGSAYFKPVGLCFVVASEFIPVSADDKVKALVADANCASLSMAVKSKAVEISQDYQNNSGKNKEKLKSDYKILFDAYMQSIKSYKEYAYAVADSEQKNNINREYNITEKYLSYDKYIESCLLNANTSWSYRVKNGKAEIVGINDSDESSQKTSFIKNLFAEPVYADDNENVLLGIPDRVGEYEVISIGKEAIKNNNNLDIVYIPDSVETIGEGAFRGCTSLNKVLLGDSVNTIEANAFKGCESIKEFELLNSVKNIGEGAFDGVNSIKALPGSTGAEYADENNIDFIEKSMKYVELEITKKPDKLAYGIDEKLDISGIKVIATGEDGTKEDVSDRIYYDYEDKKTGQNKVNVYFNDLTADYSVEVLTGECNYTVSYEDEFGDEIAEKYEGKATVGEKVELPVQDISGYVLDEQEITRTIGTENDFVITYTSIPKKDIGTAEILCVEKAEYTGKQIKPAVEVKYEDKALTQNEDYIIDYDDNIEPGLGGILIRGINDYSGYAWVDFEIIRTSNIDDPSGSVDNNEQGAGDLNDNQNNNSDKTNGEYSRTETGDDFNPLIYMVLICLTLAGIGGSLFYRKSKR